MLRICAALYPRYHKKVFPDIREDLIMEAIALVREIGEDKGGPPAPATISGVEVTKKPEKKAASLASMVADSSDEEEPEMETDAYTRSSKEANYYRQVGKSIISNEIQIND
ncbi:uncharacterized protein [Watersipora subatra]|uniref:uncharacterized protein isoform X2 n=1 Tax=Watersipora subatra TaxID=2589382 RepID=UPI00355B55C1